MPTVDRQVDNVELMIPGPPPRLGSGSIHLRVDDDGQGSWRGDLRFPLDESDGTLPDELLLVSKDGRNFSVRLRGVRFLPDHSQLSIEGLGAPPMSSDLAPTCAGEDRYEPRLRMDADPEGVMSATSAAIAQGTTSALTPQVRDVQRRMKRLSETAEDSGARHAAIVAEHALEAVAQYLDGDLSGRQVRPSARALVVLALDVGEIGLVLINPTAGAVFKGARLIGQFILRRQDVSETSLAPSGPV